MVYYIHFISPFPTFNLIYFGSKGKREESECKTVGSKKAQAVGGWTVKQEVQSSRLIKVCFIRQPKIKVNAQGGVTKQESLGVWITHHRKF